MCNDGHGMYCVCVGKCQMCKAAARSNNNNNSKNNSDSNSKNKRATKVKQNIKESRFVRSL